jgi:formate hydrogenlyase subunit 4
MDLVLLPLQIVLMLALAPLLQGGIKTMKARLQNRRGPGPLQSYRDIAKLFVRESVVSDRASWVFRGAPAVYGAAILSAAVLVPTLARRSAADGIGDIVVFVGLLALARFALALAAIDTASNFGAMGASREVAFAALVEPALLLVLFAVALPAGSTSFNALVGGSLSAGALIAFLALLIVAIAETGRIPIDNPDTHLELTMIHEGMLLEYSGRPLGILHWTTQIKQLAILALAAALFLPWGMASDATPVGLLIGFGAFVDAVALGLVLLGLAGMLVRSLDTAIWLLSLQGVLLGLAAGAVAVVEGTWAAGIAFAVALIVKAVAIPTLLRAVLDRLTRRPAVETVLPTVVAFPLAIGFVLLAYAVAQPFTARLQAVFVTPNSIPASLALLLLGCFTMVIRKKALTQVVGLVTMENGLYLAAIAATHGLPLVVEFGVALDVMTGVAVMGLVIHEIDRLFGSTGTDRLRSLRG